MVEEHAVVELRAKRHTSRDGEIDTGARLSAQVRVGLRDAERAAKRMDQPHLKLSEFRYPPESSGDSAAGRRRADAEAQVADRRGNRPAAFVEFDDEGQPTANGRR